MHPILLKATIANIQAVGGRVTMDPRTDLMEVNEELLVSLVLCRCHLNDNGTRRWKVRLDLGLDPDITIAVRMEPSGNTAMDYYVLPSIDMNLPDLRLAEQNPSDIDIYRFDTLDVLAELSRRSPYRRAA